MKEEPINAIDITLILRGDSRFETALPAADPLLADLHAAVQQPSPSRLMQVPLDGGRTALSFASTELVSVLTTPPVIIEAADSQASLQTGSYLPCVCIDDFLTPDENIKLLQYALSVAVLFSFPNACNPAIKAVIVKQGVTKTSAGKGELSPVLVPGPRLPARHGCVSSKT